MGKCYNLLALSLYTSLGVGYFSKMSSGSILLPGDAWSYNYPLLLYYASIHDLVSWLPFIFLGMPFLGMLQTGLFYPLNFLYFFLPAPFVFNLNIILHCSLAAFFVFLYARLIGVRSFPAFISGIIFAFSGFLMAHKGHTSMMNAAVWLPLLLFLYEKIRATLNPKYSAWAALVIAIQVFAGHYQICVYTYLVLGCLASILGGYKLR